MRVVASHLFACHALTRSESRMPTAFHQFVRDFDPLLSYSDLLRPLECGNLYHDKRRTPPFAVCRQRPEG